jgi:sugar/nucleoside kinase (ribokinase family)
MQHFSHFESIDYLAIGHITVDLTADGPRLGGTAAYSALTAHALGLRVGIVTGWAEDLPLGPLSQIPIVNVGAETSSTFENIYASFGRVQRYHGDAPFLEFHMIPQAWRNPRILHLAPVAREVSPRILKYFNESLLCLTPQGWLREWDVDGNVHTSDWEEGEHVLARADAAVLALEDLAGDAAQVERFAAACPTLVVTEGEAGAMVYTQGEEIHVSARLASVVDPTGAGDVFAAAFFVRLQQTSDPVAAAQFATQLAARSVERPGLAGVPTAIEINDLMAEAY